LQDPISRKPSTKRADGVAKEVRAPPSKHEALSSKPGITNNTFPPPKKKKKTQNKVCSSRHWKFMPVMLASWEAEIRRIAV
jgi:hypothetical protein